MCRSCRAFTITSRMAARRTFVIEFIPGDNLLTILDKPGATHFR